VRVLKHCLKLAVVFFDACFAVPNDARGKTSRKYRRGTKTNLTSLESIKVGVGACVNGSGTAVGNVPSLVDVRHCEGVVIDVFVIAVAKCEWF
jgi:hypothetical protein